MLLLPELKMIKRYRERRKERKKERKRMKIEISVRLRHKKRLVLLQMCFVGRDSILCRIFKKKTSKHLSTRLLFVFRFIFVFDVKSPKRHFGF